VVPWKKERKTSKPKLVHGPDSKSPSHYRMLRQAAEIAKIRVARANLKDVAIPDDSEDN
jgi:hypothetical protein